MATFRNTLPSDGRLNPNDEVVSNNGRFQLLLQTDGNLVLYDNKTTSPVPLWASNTAGQAVKNCIMQTDGNLVIYGFPNAIWASNTAGHPDSFLRGPR